MSLTQQVNLLTACENLLKEYEKQHFKLKPSFVEKEDFENYIKIKHETKKAIHEYKESVKSQWKQLWSNQND